MTLEPSGDKVGKGKARYYWEFRATLMVEQGGRPPQIVTSVPPMQFSANWISKDAPNHQNGCGWHKTGLACALYARMRDHVARTKLKVGEHGLKGKRLGFGEPKEE